VHSAPPRAAPRPPQALASSLDMDFCCRGEGVEEDDDGERTPVGRPVLSGWF
jgi:hypothetical protein